MTQVADTTHPNFFTTLDKVAFYKDWKKATLTQKIIKTVIGILKIAVAMIVDVIKLGINYFSQKRVESDKKISTLSKIGQQIRKTLKFSSGLFAKILIVSAGIYFYNYSSDRGMYVKNEIEKILRDHNIYRRSW